MFRADAFKATRGSNIAFGNRMIPMNGHVFLLAVLLSLPGCTSVVSQTQRSCYHAAEQIEKEIGFCQAIRSGSTLHVSGVTAGGAMDSAIRSVYLQLEEILKANDLSFADVVRETVFTTDLDSFIKSKEIRREFYGGALPAASWLQIQRLYLPSHVVEVELTAEYRE
jgi:2-iminobutanoate/2-iminopropanoate deaminase